MSKRCTTPSVPLSEATSAPTTTEYYTSGDGSGHLAPQRLTIETRHNTDRYPVPAVVGNIVRVRLYANDAKPFELFECPATANYIRLFANGQTPTDHDGARALLKAVRAKFGKTYWLRFDGYLYLHPHPVNAGELLVIDYEPCHP